MYISAPESSFPFIPTNWQIKNYGLMKDFAKKAVYDIIKGPMAQLQINPSQP
tara:strand:+ start:299 stop:454 length:156 start_codon:yes stop_codon:yes gene_type:complete